MSTLNILDNPDTLPGRTLDKLSAFIGNTPLFPISNLIENPKVSVLAKLEWQQFGGSVKSRPAFRIIKDAIARNDLDGNKHILDASSGNTGIAYAQLGAALGIPVTLCLPENASGERKQILRALGVHIEFTSRLGGTDEAQEMALNLYKKHPEKYFYADQYNNESNWKAHYDTTAPEILKQSQETVTHFVAGLGTTGTFTGTGRRLKEVNPDIHLTGLQPDISMHGLEGWKHLETARVPGIYDPTLADDIRTVKTEQAYETVKLAAAKEGLLLSPSSAANLAASLQLAEEIDEGVIVTVFPDDANKYGEIMNQLI